MQHEKEQGALERSVPTLLRFSSLPNWTGNKDGCFYLCCSLCCLLSQGRDNKMTLQLFSELKCWWVMSRVGFSSVSTLVVFKCGGCTPHNAPQATGLTNYHLKQTEIILLSETPSFHFRHDSLMTSIKSLTVSKKNPQKQRNKYLLSLYFQYFWLKLQDGEERSVLFYFMKCYVLCLSGKPQLNVISKGLFVCLQNIMRTALWISLDVHPQ